MVTLAKVPDMRAYLGCVMDGREIVRDWLEIWVQNLEEFDIADSGFVTQVSSEQLDSRWRTHWKAVCDISTSTVALEVPVENLRPLYLDAGNWRITRPSTPEGTEWVLCRDDQKLENAGLPKYSRSTYRYLIAEEFSGAAATFVRADGLGPLNTSAVERSSELGFDPAWVALNPQGAGMVACIHAPLDFGDFIDLLGGATIDEVAARKTDCEANLLRSGLSRDGQGGRRHGLLLTGTNCAELFYLKLRLLVQAGRALQTHLRQHQCPLLNLDPSSFGVFTGISGDLPWAWTTSCELVRPGRAFSFRIPETEEVRFVAIGESGAGAFCPAGLSGQKDLGVTIKSLHVDLDEKRQVCLEGTIWIPTPVPVGTSDILRFQLSLERITGRFYGRALLSESAFLREIPFRTWPRVLGNQEISQLKRFESGRIERCWCDIIPALSSPYDLNSFSILGARALLVHENNPLSTVIEELERLGREVSEQLPGRTSLEEAVPIVERMLAPGVGPISLASNHLFGGLPNPPKDSDCVPQWLWVEALAILIRLMPGLGAVSQCSDYGSAPTGSLHTPLDEPLAALENLCARARSLVFCDWSANRELRTVLAQLRETY